MLAAHKQIFEDAVGAIKAEGRYRVFADVMRDRGRFPHATLRLDDGASQPIVVWCSNDYLGQGQHEDVLTAAHAAIDAVGAGAGGTRNISGTTSFHVDLERELASLHGKQTALLFTSGASQRGSVMTRMLMPVGACDAHIHLARPDPSGARFDTGYAMPDASLDALRAVQRPNGLERAVIVQLSAYGSDHTVMLEALASDRANLRGVARVEQPMNEDLSVLHAAGVRANRFYLGFPVPVENLRAPVVDPERLFGFGECLRELGWAAEVSAPPSMIANLAPRLRRFPAPIVFEHMAGLSGLDGFGGRDAETVLDLIRHHDVWVKLSLSRLSKTMTDEGVRRAHDALLEAAPERMLWGSDWPHVAMSPVPDVADLLHVFDTWISHDAATKQRVFVDNPNRLFGFDLA